MCNNAQANIKDVMAYIPVLHFPVARHLSGLLLSPDSVVSLHLLAGPSDVYSGYHISISAVLSRRYVLTMLRFR